MKSLIIIFNGLVAGAGCYRLLEALWARQWGEAVWFGMMTLGIYLIGARLLQGLARP